MAETKQITFSYKEVTGALLKQQGIHEGIWGIYIRFGIKGANVEESPDVLRPSAVVPVLEIGIQRFKEESNLAVDAAQVNPKSSAQSKRRRTRKR